MLEFFDAKTVNSFAEAFFGHGVFLEPEHGLLEQRLNLRAGDEAAERRAHARLLAPRAADINAVNDRAFVADSLKRTFAGADAAGEALFIDI